MSDLEKNSQKNDIKKFTSLTALKLLACVFFINAIVFCVIHFSPFFKASTGETHQPIFINSSASVRSLENVLDQISFIKSTFSKEIVLATDTSVSNAVALHASDGSIYYTNNKGNIVISGDIYDIRTGISLLDESKAMRYFSDTSITADEVKRVKEDVDSDLNSSIEAISLSDNYAEIMRKKVASISESKVVKDPTQKLSYTHSNNTSSSHMPMLSNAQVPITQNGHDESCLITFGGFNQPKVGYDDKCNVLSPEAKKEQIKLMMGGFPDSFFVKHQAENERAEIYVFTDYTCGYCKKLHKQIDAFLKNGISVNYIFYPRAVGVVNNDSVSREVVTNMSSAWCSADQVAAIEQLYRTGYVPFTECDKKDEKLDSPVRQHYILGMMFGIEGTPLTVGGNGETTYGFRSVGTTLTRLKL
jgi:hypothetical protein